MANQSQVGIIRLQVDIKFDVEQLAQWEPERIKSLMDGIAMVASATNEQRKDSQPQGADHAE